MADEIKPEESSIKEVPVKTKSVENSKKESTKNTEAKNGKNELPDSSEKEAAVDNNSDGSKEEKAKTSAFDEIVQIATKIQDIGVTNYIDSLPFDDDNRRRALRLGELINELRPKQISYSTETDAASENLKRQSSDYRAAYRELTQKFEEWELCRKKLVQLLKNSPCTIRTISNFVHGFRICTCVADIAGTYFRSYGTKNSWAVFAMENASLCASVVAFLERVYTNKVNYEIEQMSAEDGKLFGKVDECFNRIKKIDDNIRNIFSNGFDSALLDKFNKSNNDVSELFFAIIFSNADDKKHKKFEEVLEMAKCVSTLQYDKLLQKLVLENDPRAHLLVNTELCNKIKENLEKMSKKYEEKKKSEEVPHSETVAEVSYVLSLEAKIKMLLNAASILLSLKSVIGKESELPKSFEEIAEDGEKQLEEIKKIIDSIKPPDFPVEKPLDDEI